MTSINRIKCVARIHWSPPCRLPQEELEKLSPIRKPIVDEKDLASLLKTLSTPVQYLQDQLRIPVLRGDIAIADTILDYGAQIDSDVIFTACYKTKSIAMFDLLIQHGWNVNIDMGSGTPPLG
jgi:hypothetical protein